MPSQSPPNQIARRIRDLSDDPQWGFLPTESDDETSEVEPDKQENPIDGDTVRFEPQRGTLKNSLDILQDKVAWAIDGGALTVDLPMGRLLVGRAVVVRVSFRGYESVRRELIVPALPLMVCGGTAVKDLPQSTSLFLSEAVRIVPAELATRRTPLVDYFSDGQSFLDKFSDSWAGATKNETETARAIDVVRNAAETIAFQTALRLAQPGEIVLRDGRLHGSVGFWTGIAPSQTTPQNVSGGDALNTFVQDVESAIRRGVRVVGVIKRSASSECSKWLRTNGLPQIRYGNDAVLYLNASDRIQAPDSKFGKRSTLWRYIPRKAKDTSVSTSRTKLDDFRLATSFFYIVPGLNVPPFRIDLPRQYDKYLTWYEEVADQIYTFARGSGSPSRIPHPITTADSVARVHRAEAVRFLYGLISDLEGFGDEKSKALARDLKAWIHRGR